VAFIFGLYFVSIAVFFSLLARPWLYIWAYIGITMRMAVIVSADAANSARITQQRATPSAAAVRRHDRPRRSLQMRRER
jgi:hypothetical protein